MRILKYANCMSGFVAKTLVLGGILMGIIGIGIFEAQRTPELNDAARAALRETGMDRAYAMHVETLVELGDRELAIDGIYRIDAPLQAYASESTTTLTIRDSGEAHSFSLRNVSMEDIVYVSVASESPLLTHTLPLTNGWRSFESAAIPAQFSGIAVHGPILDNALLFGEDGAHLTFVEEIGEGEEKHYAFKLSDPQAQPGGTLQTLFERIGVDGRARVWIKEGRISMFVLSGSDYVSTTTLLSDEVPITPPL